MNTPTRRRGYFSARAAARLTSRALTLSRRTRARGVTMVEYVLLIAIAVFLAWLLREQLGSMFSGILDDIRSALNTGR